MAAFANWFRHSRWWVKLSLVLSALLFLLLLTHDSTLILQYPSPTDLTPLSLVGVARILILAPHCDDETLGPGGLITAAVKAGKEVRVIIATNGDGFTFATMEEFRKLYPHAQDYIHMGMVRQQESLAALSKLGVSADKVYFLSYPDRGTPSLFIDHWSASDPYLSPYNEANKSPYPLTYNPSSVYAGEDYLAGVTAIIQDYLPDLVIYPHPDDVHPDHWGLNAFTRLALTELNHKQPMYEPRHLTYLVHRPDFPVLRGLKPAEALVPPLPLYEIYPDWYRRDLAAEDEAIKNEAVFTYRSQLPLLRSLLVSFIRVNELFAPVSSPDLPTLATGDPLDPSSWRNTANQPVSPIQLDPIRDNFFRKDWPSSDLSALFTARSTDMLWTCAQVRGRASEDIPYDFHLKSLTEKGILPYSARSIKPQTGEGQAVLNKSYVCFQVSMLDLGSPWAIYMNVESESLDPNLPYDQTAWQMAYVK